MPESSDNLTFLEIRHPQENEYTLESMSSLLSNFVQFASVSFWDRLRGKKPTIASLEIVLFGGQIHFVIVTPSEHTEFFRSQTLAQYPSAITREITDYLLTGVVNNFSEHSDRSSISMDPEGSAHRKNSFTSQLHSCLLGLSRIYDYPVKTAKDFKETDPLNSVLAPISRSNQTNDFFLYQVLISNAPKNWQSSIISVIQNGIVVDKEKGFRQPHPDKAVFEQKIQYPGLLTQINLISTSPGLISAVSSSFGVYTSPRGNFIKTCQPGFFSKGKLLPSIFNREIKGGLKNQVLNTEELAALWHFPNRLTKLPNIAWGKKLYADPPENLPILEGLSDDQKKSTT
ncbi:MAG: hypothetical protein WC686_05765, partial [Candidatus Shapirobacteria bacterium]